MEYWNTGILIAVEKPNIPSPHHSRFPKRLQFTNLLGRITYGYLKDCFWSRVIRIEK
jgi:hypothetical protein